MREIFVCFAEGGGQLLLSLSWAIFPQFYADEGRKTQHMMLSALHDITELHCTAQRCTTLQIAVQWLYLAMQCD